MSTDFIALFDASRDAVDLQWLQARLWTDPLFGAGIVDYWRDRWGAKEWEIDSGFRGPRLLVPGGFAFHLESRLVEMYHVTPFWTFSDDRIGQRAALRRTCRLVAELVESNRAFYMHELLPRDGDSLNEVEKGLREKIGPPATSFEEMSVAFEYGPGSWYIDNFADLCHSER